MSEFKTYKEQSRINWGSTEEKLTLEQINTGAILRIADATESMAKNYTQMENDLKYYKDLANDRLKIITSLNNVNSVLRGHLTRLKNKSCKK